MTEMPHFLSTTYAAGNASAPPFDTYAINAHAGEQVWPYANAINTLVREPIERARETVKTMMAAAAMPAAQPKETEEMSTPARRMVRVWFCDPDPNVPAEQALLFDSREQLTDKTDQELFFEMSVPELLKTHNERRVQLIDKSIKDRTAKLEPARIRDLKMVVITLAQF